MAKPEKKAIAQKNELDLLTMDYRDIVDMCANNKVCAPLPNRSITHAKILTSAILRNANENVQIFSGSLNEVFLKTVEQDIWAALDGNSDIHVEIVLEHTNKLSSTAKKLNKSGRVSFSRMNKKHATFPHFCVSGNMYRTEDPHPADQDFSTNPEVHAQANFNAPDTAIFLKKKFDELKAEPIG